MGKIVKKEVMEKKHEGEILSRGYTPPIIEGGVVNKKVLSAGDDAKHIIDDAREEAKRIVDRAQKLRGEVDRIREKAKKDGFEAGKNEGLEIFTQKLFDLEDVREKFYKDAEKEIIKLVLSISEKVIGKLVHEHRGIIEAVVEQALERAIGDRITVRLNPSDLAELKENKKDFGNIIDRTKRLAFKEDESIEKGGCVVETEVGTIDARIETQLGAIKKTLGVK